MVKGEKVGHQKVPAIISNNYCAGLVNPSATILVVYF